MNAMFVKLIVNADNKVNETAKPPITGRLPWPVMRKMRSYYDVIIGDMMCQILR